MLLQSATGITKCDSFITKCDKYYKVRRLLQSATLTGSLLVRMAIIGDEDGGFLRIAISRSFPNLLYRLFADLQMPAHFRELFQPCSSLGII